MPEIVQCPECQRKLKVPDNLLGKNVKCPTCGATFTAAGEAAPEPAAAPAPARRPREEAYEEEPAPPRRREDYEEDEGDYEERPRRRRRRPVGDYQTPNRGGTILTMGIFSIVLAICCAIAGIGLGIGALTMANTDLAKMERGEMDPSGMGSTRGGQICGIIGLILGGLNMVAGVIIVIASNANH
jgi:predicted Zn finger-like uncharacterized protein